MAFTMSVSTAKTALVIALTAILGACASSAPKQPVLASPPEIVDRFDQNGLSGEVSPGQNRAFVDQSDLRADAPVEYTVVRGDTLWDISERYLNQPWLWTQIWESNPHIENPHLIYPGDKVELEYIDGQPYILLTQETIGSIGAPRLGAANAPPQLDENGNPIPVYSDSRIKVAPAVRATSLDSAIPTIAGDSIQQFLVHPQVVDAETLANAPYVVGNHDNRLTSSIGSHVYARGDIRRRQTNYGIYRESGELRDPETDQLLGYEITHVADARLLNLGDPSTLIITNNKMETVAGDILLASSKGEITHQYHPRLPKLNGDGRIVSLVNAISQSGRDQVVVLNMGKNSNIKAGDVLAIETRGKELIDERAHYTNKEVTMPNVRTGVLMVFKAFDKVSYALVMESTRPVMVNDIVAGI